MDAAPVQRHRLRQRAIVLRMIWEKWELVFEKIMFNQRDETMI
jgi:hypothetical protein